MYDVIDSVPTWVFLLTVAIVLTLASRFGASLGRNRATPDGSVDPHTSAISAALLALLGLLLAFAYGGVESRFAARKAIVLREANAIGTTFLRAGLLDADERDIAREALREYVNIRLSVRKPADLTLAVKRSEDVHKLLWHEAEEAARRHPNAEVTPLFVSSLNDLIDVHQDRVTVAVYQRLPVMILAVLGALAVLSLGVLGYAGGLARVRSRFPSAAMIVAVSAVATLIVELDRPFSPLLRVNLDPLISVRSQLNGDDTTPEPP